MELIQIADPIENRKKKYSKRHFELYHSAGWARTSTANESRSDCTWVVCRFSPHSETLLYLGDDEGNIGIVDVAHTVGCDGIAQTTILQCFPAHEATVMDVMGVPNCPNNLLSISGDTTVRLWDLQHQQSTLYFGHEMSVRSVCFAPNCSNVFATGGRDGQILLWDTRISSHQKQGQLLKNPVNVYRNAHVVRDFRTPPKRRSTSLRLSGRLEKVEPPSVTSLVYANEYTLVSASSNAKSGIRLWDTRKVVLKEEGHVVSTLEVPISKDAGVTSLCLDRYGSSLFAAVTDNCVYEYGILTSNNKPVRHFTGATIESFYVQVQASPNSDHLLCGSKNQQAVLWDLQGFHNYSNVRRSSTEYPGRATFPMFTLNGHDSEVCCVSWSCSGRYIASMDDEHIRIWSADSTEFIDEKSVSNSNMEYIRPYGLTETEKATLLVNKMKIYRDKLDATVPPMSTFSSSRKRKEPFASPIKRLKTPTKSSPISKMIKLTSPVMPLSNITNATSDTLGSDANAPLFQRRPRKSAFHYRYPTENLPNRVYERFVAKLKARRLVRGKSSSPQLAQPPCSSKKKLEDFYVQGAGELSKLGRPRLPSIVEFGDSVCSKMLTEEDRALQNSPRKLTVKLTPLKSRPLNQTKGLINSHRRSSRNLLDYFSKK